MKSLGNNMHEKNDFAAANETLLWRFIDGVATEAEKIEIEILISSNLQWKEKYAELLQLNEILRSTELDQPSVRFTKNVMEQVTQYRIASSTSGYVNKNIFLFIGGLFLSLILICFVLVLQNINWQNTTTDSSGIQSPVDAEKISHAILNSNHIFLWIAANVILGFYFIGKYLAGKRKHHPVV